MFNQNSTVDTKVAVLEERLSSYELMMKKIDEAIQIMGKTSLNISKMLAVHEEKIEQCSRTDDMISKMIGELREENRSQHKEVESRIDDLETKIEEVSKIKWMTIGSAAVLAIVVSSFASLVSGWWTPSELKTHKEVIHKSN